MRHLAVQCCQVPTHLDLNRRRGLGLIGCGRMLIMLVWALLPTASGPDSPFACGEDTV